jgi:hypothetical protein
MGHGILAEVPTTENATGNISTVVAMTTRAEVLSKILAVTIAFGETCTRQNNATTFLSQWTIHIRYFTKKYPKFKRYKCYRISISSVITHTKQHAKKIFQHVEMTHFETRSCAKTTMKFDNIFLNVKS